MRLPRVLLCTLTFTEDLLELLLDGQAVPFSRCAPKQLQRQPHFTPKSSRMSYLKSQALRGGVQLAQLAPTPSGGYVCYIRIIFMQQSDVRATGPPCGSVTTPARPGSTHSERLGRRAGVSRHLRDLDPLNRGYAQLQQSLICYNLP